MSSFVIDKVEYVKAAGMVAGIVEGTWCITSGHVFLYDYQARRVMGDSDIYSRFVECFEMNALSVAEQYEDNELCTDGRDYMKDFEAYKEAGKNAVLYPEKLRDAIYALYDFFDSAIYQTEKEAYFFKMKLFFYGILVELMKLLYPHECKCWGQFNL